VKSKKAILIDLMYMEKGLAVPGCDVGPWLPVEDGAYVQRALNSLPEDESRTARRKFRKFHRKCRKNLEKATESWKSRSVYDKVFSSASGCRPTRSEREVYVEKELDFLRNQYGRRNAQPGYDQAGRRRRLVFDYLRKESGLKD